MKKLLSCIAFATIAISFMGCITTHDTLTQNDFRYLSGFSNNKLYLDGKAGSTKKFEIFANYSWHITDIKGFICNPSSGEKTSETEIVATALNDNNSGDTIRLSDINFDIKIHNFL